MEGVLMGAPPGGRLATSVVHDAIRCELALGIDATLEATERELAQVRAVLRVAIADLVAELGEGTRAVDVAALRFQHVSDQLLASMARRIGMVRAVLGNNVVAPSHDNTGEPRESGAPDFIEELP
jgi:hypothetical protein